MLTTGTAAADKVVKETQKAVKALKEDPPLVSLKYRNTGERHVTEGTPTLSSGAGASHVNQCDWDNKSLAV